MKHLLTITLLFCVFITNATILRVNNNSGVVAVPGLLYLNLDNAFTDAQDGDTLYLEPSSTSYSTASLTNITKRLVWYGNGYQIGENSSLITPLSYSTLESKFSANSSVNIKNTAAGSVFNGINFFSGNVNVEAGATAVEFHRCSFTNDLQLISSNNLVNQCFFSHQGSIFGNGTNNLIKNSIINEAILTQVGAVIDNSFINSVGFGNSSMPENCAFTNCIILHAPSAVPLTNTFSHCMKLVNQTTSSTTFPIAGINNNVENVPIENVFIVANPLASTRRDRDFRLSITSPAKNVGINGVDMGAFGGTNPYRLSGQPPVPVITNFFLSTTGSTSSGLTGSITIKSNN